MGHGTRGTRMENDMAWQFTDARIIEAIRKVSLDFDAAVKLDGKEFESISRVLSTVNKENGVVGITCVALLGKGLSISTVDVHGLIESFGDCARQIGMPIYARDLMRDFGSRLTMGKRIRKLRRALRVKPATFKRAMLNKMDKNEMRSRAGEFGGKRGT